MTVKAIRIEKNRYTDRICARCGKLIGHLRLMASIDYKPWTCMPCEWLRREQLKRLMQTPPRPGRGGDREESP